MDTLLATSDKPRSILDRLRFIGRLLTDTRCLFSSAWPPGPVMRLAIASSAVIIVATTARITIGELGVPGLKSQAHLKPARAANAWARLCRDDS